jgi:hypothetical protein
VLSQLTKNTHVDEFIMKFLKTWWFGTHEQFDVSLGLYSFVSIQRDSRVMLCYAMTISGIQTHYLRWTPVSTIHPLTAFKLYALQWYFHDNQGMPSHWSIVDGWTHPDSRGQTTGSVSLILQEIAPMSSPAFKSIYGSAVYLFRYTAFPPECFTTRKQNW